MACDPTNRSSSSDSAGSNGTGPATSYRLVPVSLVKANGERRELTSMKSQGTELPRYLTKIATDPVTREVSHLVLEGQGWFDT